MLHMLPVRMQCARLALVQVRECVSVLGCSPRICLSIFRCSVLRSACHFLTSSLGSGFLNTCTTQQKQHYAHHPGRKLDNTGLGNSFYPPVCALVVCCRSKTLYRGVCSRRKVATCLGDAVQHSRHLLLSLLTTVAETSCRQLQHAHSYSYKTAAVV
jgi:hypothetical protein